MKTTRVIGLFVNSQKADKISNSLKIAGFSPQSFSMHNISENVFAMNVFVKDHFEVQMARNILDFYRPEKMYDVENLGDSDVRSYIMAHSKAEIFESPVIRKRVPHEGINSEVHF